MSQAKMQFPIKRKLTAAIVFAWLVFESATSSVAQSYGGGSYESDEAALAGVLSGRGSMDSYQTVRAVPVAVARIDGINFLGVTLSEVRKRFGQVPNLRTSQIEGAPVGLCYAADDRVIVFRAGPMGSWNEVTGISFLRKELVGFKDQCGVSGPLTSWFKASRRQILSPVYLAQALGLSKLPKDGVLSEEKIVERGMEMVRTTALAYSDDEHQLRWLDISQFSER